ncbi:hypothetical protein B5C34_08770 [Pacificimonas flava]|uniref:Uncharacterized protein n=2 Tax=Pacificimonas TaxID=1960290 RepID=A0A219B5T2_9SPHN|nr:MULTISPECIES: hypothetical protein [Pacificimonas]MBZ6379242.1 hypothetical protein [Pacificimonas aurantium]OWV33544.1 hypothetical protein B5C34_08770 [Pacificimonas flava]
MQVRRRQLTDSLGSKFRTRIYGGAGDLQIELEDVATSTSMFFDLYNAELLAGFIMATRLTSPRSVPEEHTVGAYAAVYQSVREPVPAIRITQESGLILEIRSTFWDQLFAELNLVCAHVRARSYDSLDQYSGRELAAH